MLVLHICGRKPGTVDCVEEQEVPELLTPINVKCPWWFQSRMAPALV